MGGTIVTFPLVHYFTGESLAVEPKVRRADVHWRYRYDRFYRAARQPTPAKAKAAFSWDATSNPPTVQFFNESVAVTSSMWDFGDGESSSEFSPSHEYSFTGDVATFLVCLTINGNPALQVCHLVEVSNLLGGPTLSLWTLSLNELYNLSTQQLYDLLLIEE